MKSERELHILHEMTTCVYFNGIQHEKCKAGITYRTLFGDGPGWAAHLYCMSDPEAKQPCELRKFMTRNEAEKEVTHHDEVLERFMKCHKAAKVHAKAQGFKTGNGGIAEITCPSGCGGLLRYSVANVNGHMHARCSTDGCVSWME